MNYPKETKFISIDVSVALVVHFMICCLINGEILSWGTVVSNSQFLQIYGLSFTQCVLECQLRPNCLSVNYKLVTKRCEVNDIGAPLVTTADPGAVYSKRSDWKQVSFLDVLCT